MKKVFTSSKEVIELWVNGTQEEARCSNGSIFFNDIKKIYSYGSHYILAEKRGFDTVMINDTGYSKTTAKHISQVTNSTKYLNQFFKTETDLDLVHKSVIYYRDKLKKARRPELYNKPILHLWETLNGYFKYMGGMDYIVQWDKKYNEIKAIVEAINNIEVKVEEVEEVTSIKELQALFMS